MILCGISPPWLQQLTNASDTQPRSRVALLDRILKVSCPPDGVVMDPFCGCGTTLHAAQNLGLRWIGIDICVKACQVIEKRLKQSFDTLWDQVQFLGLPKTRDRRQDSCVL